MQLKDRLKEIRRNRDLTLLQVSQVTKLSVSYLSDLERGRTNPSLETLERLSAYYKLSMIDLISGVDGWGTLSEESLAPELLTLVQQNKIEKDVAKDLNRIELRGKRPQTEEEWYELYLYLKSVMKPYFENQAKSEEG